MPPLIPHSLTKGPFHNAKACSTGGPIENGQRMAIKGPREGGTERQNGKK